jgi:hypothetical protein
MKVIDPGHVYALDSIDGVYVQSLTFVKREGDKWPGNQGHHPGTTSQEVLRALINRFKYVNQQLPCWETQACIHMAETMIGILESRAARVHGRVLEIATLAGIDYFGMCPVCGHVLCPHAESTKENHP